MKKKILAFERLHDIAVGTAKGIAYLHEECQQRIIYYDIKLGNILLDGKLNPEVTDFGLAKFCIREKYSFNHDWGRRNLGVQLVESQEWFPMCIWKRFDVGEFQKLIIACGIEEKNREITERMVDVALSFVQYRSDSRPIMSDVVKMLEGSVEMSKTLNPFQPFMDGNFTSHPVQVPLTYTTDTNGFSDVVTDSSIVHVILIL
ncbi:Putative receptor-like protein kinase [Glycine soja]|uniref:Putative receptor-like protein kinase n=1 Tax=Glycine soja TaxID=3848 RepID=A0A0B2QSI0_GLYSO|nr:Putative receptor-like protein kinase [Glycine soja]